MQRAVPVLLLCFILSIQCMDEQEIIDQCTDKPEMSERLCEAVRCGDEQLVSQLLQRSVEVNIADAGGNRPLHIACGLGYSSIVSLLLDSKALVNLQNNAGETPLQLACLHWYLDIVKMLLKYGADVNVTDLRNRSPLIYTIMLADPTKLLVDQVMVLAQLLKAGAVITTGCSERLCWLLAHVLQKAGLQELVEKKQGNQAYKIIRRRHYSLGLAKEMREAVEAGLDLNGAMSRSGNPYFSLYADGESYVHAASMSKGAENLAFALDHGGNAEAKSEKIQESRTLTPLSLAVFWDCYENVRFLVEHGADVNGRGCKSPANDSPLQLAIKKHNRAIAKFLVDRGAIVDSSSKVALSHLLAHTI